MTAISDLIRARKGERTFHDLEVASGLPATRWQQLTIMEIQAPPTFEAISQLAVGLDLPADEVLRAAAADLGIDSTQPLEAIASQLIALAGSFPRPASVRALSNLLGCSETAAVQLAGSALGLTAEDRRGTDAAFTRFLADMASSEELMARLDADLPGVVKEVLRGAAEASDVPVGATLREVKTGNLYEVTAGVAEAGGYYEIRAIDPPADMPAYLRESRLQPGHIGSLFVVVKEVLRGVAAESDETDRKPTLPELVDAARDGRLTYDVIAARVDRTPAKPRDLERFPENRG